MGRLKHAVEAMKLGANDFLVKPFDPEGLGLLLTKLMEHKRLLDETQYLRGEVSTFRTATDKIIGKSQAMLELFDAIKDVSASDSSILIVGETGREKNWWPGPFMPTVSEWVGPSCP